MVCVAPLCTEVPLSPLQERRLVEERHYSAGLQSIRNAREELEVMVSQSWSQITLLRPAMTRVQPASFPELPHLH